MKIVALNTFQIVKGEEAWLPFILVDDQKPVYLTPYWQRLTARISNPTGPVLVKTTDNPNEAYCFFIGPPAMFAVKLSPDETLALPTDAILNVSIMLETTIPGISRQWFSFPAALKAVAPSV